MMNIQDILFDICDDELVYEDNIDLIESGLLDSFALIELLSRLEDDGIEIQPTRIDRNKFRTVKGIEQLINEYLNK